ncbi:MAG TPA: hypothetical protein VIU61_01935 [Kofleriaceae bacterium]
MCSESVVLTRSSYELPSGCPVVVAASAAHPTFEPIVTVTRNGTSVDVTRTVTTTATSITALAETVTPNGSGCSVNSDHAELPFDIHTISIAGAAAGEQLLIDGSPVAVIVAAGRCPAVAPIQPSEVECRVTHEQYWNCTCEVRPDAWECGGTLDEPPDTAGCSAASPGLAAAMLFVFALRRGRRLIQA